MAVRVHRFTPMLFFLLLSLGFSASTLAAQAPASAAPSEPGSEALYEFEITRDWLTMPDGVRLSVTYFKPISREQGKRFPVLFEFLPYRKDDRFYLRDYPLYSYFARRGYVIAKVDIRGTGSSEGRVPPREYSEVEIEDALEIIDQLSRAPWSNGKVGMWGISWSGFNALQVAMRRPPALKAIMAAHASDDLYHDDVHYTDGVFHVDEYELSIDQTLGLPRSPDYLLDDAYFEERFNSYPWLLTYLKQQQDGPFWREKSLRWNYGSIEVPVYLIGGLLDGYRDTVPRLLENLKVPMKAVIGPWNHSWPDNGEPGPNFEWRHELVRWWDTWLKGSDTGLMEEPRFALFVRDGHPPDASLKTTPGHWRYEDWPIARTRWKRFYPSPDHRLRSLKENSVIDHLEYSAGYGFAAGYWWGEPTGDMRPVDAGSLVYDSDPLSETLEIAGFPRVRLRVSTDAKLAHWMLRLEDVHPGGRVSLVTGAALNGAQRDSRTNPDYLKSGEVVVVDIPLHFTTWTFRPGHRIRLAVSNGLFPMFWPTPFPMTTQLFVGDADTYLELPAIAPAQRPTPAFLPPQPREQRPDAHLKGKGWPYSNRVIRDMGPTTTVEWKGQREYELPGVHMHVSQEMVYETREENPAESLFRSEASTVIRRKARRVELRTAAEIRSDLERFHVRFTRRIFENGTLVRERTWQETIPRLFQ
jgi:predicted acyl esterase